MTTVLAVVSSAPVPAALRRIIDETSSRVEVVTTRPQTRRTVDRLLVWTGVVLEIDGHFLRWPEDERDIRSMLGTPA